MIERIVRENIEKNFRIKEEPEETREIVRKKLELEEPEIEREKIKKLEIKRKRELERLESKKLEIE